MPIYDYTCAVCGVTFSHFWRSMRAAQQGDLPVCTACGSNQTQRIISRVGVLGSMGGLTPPEQAAQGRQQARAASITPKEQIDKLRNKPKAS